MASGLCHILFWIYLQNQIRFLKVQGYWSNHHKFLLVAEFVKTMWNGVRKLILCSKVKLCCSRYTTWTKQTLCTTIRIMEKHQNPTNNSQIILKSPFLLGNMICYKNFQIRLCLKLYETQSKHPQKRSSSKYEFHYW